MKKTVCLLVVLVLFIGFGWGGGGGDGSSAVHAPLITSWDLTYDPAGAIAGNGTMADPFILVIGDDLIFDFCVEDTDRNVVRTNTDQFTPWNSPVLTYNDVLVVPPCAADECCWFTTVEIIGPVGTWRVENTVLDAEGNSDMITFYATTS